MKKEIKALFKKYQIFIDPINTKGVLESEYDSLIEGIEKIAQKHTYKKIKEDKSWEQTDEELLHDIKNGLSFGMK